MSVSKPRIGRYELLARIGKGGMATVYLARTYADPFARLLAIKLLHEDVAGEPELVALFLREAEIASRIQHINIVPLLEVGFHESAPFLVMDYVEGSSLSALLTESPDVRSPRLIVPIILDALNGLAAVHGLRDDNGDSLRLVHRDVSPGNLMVGIDGACRLTDFGVARWPANQDLTQPGTIRGTPGYMAPEQVAAREVDARADLFSVGVILWTALTGRSLFKGENLPATLFNVLQRRIPRPSEVGLRPPPCFDEICLRALQRDPNKRYFSALEMAEALRAVAVREGLLGSPNEVAQWTTEVFGPRLTERRRAVAQVVKTASVGVVEDDQEVHSPASLSSLPPILSIVPQSGSTPTLDELRTGVGHLPQGATMTSYPSLQIEVESERRRGHKAWLALPLLALAGAALVFALRGEEPDPPPPAPPPPPALAGAVERPPVAAVPKPPEPEPELEEPVETPPPEVERRPAPKARRAKRHRAALVPDAGAPAPVEDDVLERNPYLRSSE